MGEENWRIRIGIGVVKVRLQVHCFEYFRKALARIDFSFANAVHSGSVAEELVGQLMKFSLIIGKARVILWFGTSNHRSLSHQLIDRAQHRQRHVFAVRIKRENLIVHSAGGCDLSIADFEFMNEAIGVDVVEAIARRNVRRLIGEDRSQVRILTVEVKYVCGKMPLLQQVARTGKIVHPRRCFVGPGFIAVEPLAKGSKRKSGRLIHQRLMRRFMDDKSG